MIRIANRSSSVPLASTANPLGIFADSIRRLFWEALESLTTLPPRPPPAAVGRAIHDAAASISDGNHAVTRRNEQLMLTFARIESSFNPSAVTGSYKGLYQLSEEEFRRYGGGNILSARDNAMAAAKKLKAEAADFQRVVGRRPDATDIYMVHQQGFTGYRRHMSNANDPAWINMNVASGRRRDDDWGKRAIWGNMSSSMKEKFPGGVTSVKSRDFVKLWRDEVEALYAYYADYVLPMRPATVPAA